MRKDVVIAGAIVAACLGLVVVAFALPKKSKSTSSEQDAPIVTDFGNNTAPVDGFGTAPSAPVGFGSPTTPSTSPGFGSTTTPSGFGTPAPSAPGFAAPSGTTTAPVVGFGSTKPTAPLSTPTPVINEPTAPVAPAPTAASSGEKTHVVAKGETLGDISMKYYGSSKHWKKIAEANKIDPSSLQVGTKLTIPEVAAPASAATSSDAATGEHTYKIKAGDTYYTIAKKELGSAARWKEIEKLNKLSPDELRVGMSIKLPAGGKNDKASDKGGDKTTADAGSGRTHTVAAGETLGDISRKHFGTSKHWKKIVEANPGVDPEGLKVGQKLNLPEIAGAPAAGNDQSAAPVATSGAEYVVKAGDTMEIIAQNQLGKKTDAKRILEANPGVDPRKLRIGQKLIIPGKSAAAEPAPIETPMPMNTPTPAPTDFGTPTPAPLQPLPPSNGGFNPPADNPFAQPGLNNGSNPP